MTVKAASPNVKSPDPAANGYSLLYQHRYVKKPVSVVRVMRKRVISSFISSMTLVYGSVWY